MLAHMSAFSFLTGPAAADNWPAAPVLAGMSAVPVGHAIDLAFFFPNEGRERHDALMAETRRHLGACVTGIERSLRFVLEQQPEVAAFLGHRMGAICWPTICAQPTLLGPALLAHMQMRAGVTLLLRQLGQPDDRLDEAEAEIILPTNDAAVTEALAALAAAEGRWVAVGAEDEPMQPDLPAEHYADLMWTAAACLMAVVQRSASADADAILPAFEKAGRFWPNMMKRVARLQPPIGWCGALASALMRRNCWGRRWGRGVSCCSRRSRHGGCAWIALMLQTFW